uniref:Uncharacterized protein n=1 Tax=Tetradesmus obliquus TaxID=3088 RepID=A0A383WN17_TETOB|eukprot:jgi/Sobl393_1/1609/SZX78569.1
MDVQAAQWNAQLNRMVSLCMQEAAEYERGRTLQVLQPSLASLLQPSQRPVVAAANAQNAGQQSASGPVQSGTPSKPQEQHAPGSSASQAAAVDSSGQAVASIKSEEVAAPNPQQTPAASRPAAADAAVTAPFCTPMATLAGAPGLGLLPSHTPLGATQQDGMLSMPAASVPPAAVVLSSGLNSQQMLACNGMLRLPLQQQKPGETTPAAAAAHVTPQQFHIACPTVDAAAHATPALLLPALGNPLMQHMLMQQAQQQQLVQQQQQQQASPGVFVPVITTTQPNTRKGKRRGYSIQPEALKALVARQMQAKRQPKSEQQQEQQDPQQQQEQQQMQPPTGLQQQQLGARLQPQQQHRQRSMPRVPPMLHQPHAGGSLDGLAAAAAEEESPGSAVPGLLPLQLPMSLVSPGAACLGLKMTCAEELEQPGVQLELDTAKLFGSAQKRLRLSICDEPHLHAACGSLGGHQQDQLTAALISPVAVPAAAAVARDAAVAALPPAGAGAAAGQHHTSLELPHVGLVTPSKFFAGSPVATLGGAATRGSATGVGADVPQPVFATPSKFFSGSPVADDAAYKRSSLQDTEPETPLLFGHGAASPWPPRQLAMDMQPPAVCGAGAAAAAAAGSNSSVLRSSGGAGMAASSRQDANTAAGGAQPMSWVPVGSHAGQSVGLMAAAHDATGLAATPAGAAMKLGLLCTPLAAGQGGADDGSVLDAAAAAAAPVDCLPVKGASAAAAIAAEAVAPAEGDAAAAAAALPVGLSLTTPAGQAQQVLATPVTGV